jgi:hypothetical protein
MMSQRNSAHNNAAIRARETAEARAELLRRAEAKSVTQELRD